MADHIISIEYHNPVNWTRWFRNGMIVSYGHHWLYQQIAQAAQWRKKLVFSHTQDFANINTAEGSGTYARWRFRFRSGYASHRLIYAVLLGLEDHSTGADPRCYFDLTEVGVATTSSDTLRYGQFSGTPDDTPDEWMWTSITQSINPNTEYECVLQTVDYCRPVACIVTTAGALTGLDDSLTGAVNPTLAQLGTPILDSDISSLAGAGTYLWANNGSVLLSWSGENATNAAEFTVSTTTYTNPFDSTTTPSAATIGHTVQTTYHNTSTETTVPVEFSAYVETNDLGGEAGAGDGGYVLLTDGTNTIELGINPGTTAGWQSVTGTIPAALAKFDVHLKVQGVTNSLKLWAFTLAEYEA